mgnify:CR=1 FL=1
MALNKQQVKLRSAKVRERIQQLELKKETAVEGIRWYRSQSFKTHLEQGHGDRLAPNVDSDQYTEILLNNGRAEHVQELVLASRSLPDHVGTRALTPHPARVAMIADTFLYETFEGTADITYVTRDNFREVARNSDVLILASTWRGRFQDWIGTTNVNGRVIREVIPEFKAVGVPVIFYSKEDPPNYSVFLPLARRADVIFTSAQEKIPSYHKDCPEVEHIEAITFGVSPFLHTPVGSRRERRQEIMFAGSWLTHKYSNRQKHGRMLFDGVIDSGRDLLIVDRNSTLGISKYQYPQQYLDHVGPGIEHKDLMKVQRMLDVQLNLNSVGGSPTMYANRVVELQAMGSFVVSNYSLAVNDNYPEVQLIDSAEEVPFVLDAMRGDTLYRAQNDGLRRVWEHDTAWQRMAQLLNSVGAPVATTSERTALVPVSGTDVEHVRRVAENQTAPVDVLDMGEIAARRAEYDIVVPIAEDHEYSSVHVRDLLNVFRYADVDIATKNGSETNSVVTPNDDHELVREAASAARSALRTVSDDDALSRWLETGQVAGNAYSASPFGAGPKGMESIQLQDTAAPELSVVVPVYNNGKHLVSKCFRSLQRSTIFDRMEVLLIDDGSTDGYTPQVVRELADRYVNVHAHFFETGGSGSASRPRNEGLKLAKAPFITYLDPDNEALNDGYRVLLERVKELKVQFAIGNMVKLTSSRKDVNNAALLNSRLPKDPVGGRMVPDNVMELTKFQPMSIQALVADTAWLRSIGLHQPLGALGQDSLAFQQMLHGARRIATVKLPIHVYYGAVSNSMVNTVGPGFYRKYLPMERYRREWLDRDGLFEDYCRLRVDPFFNGWLVQKFNRFVSPEHKQECRALLDDLCAIYDVQLAHEDPNDLESPIYVVVRENEKQPVPEDISADVEAQHSDLGAEV